MKATETKQKQYDILEFVLFIFSVLFLSYVFVKCTDEFCRRAADRRDTVVFTEHVEVLMPVEEVISKEPVSVNVLEDTRSEEERQMSEYRRYASEIGEQLDLDPALILAVCEVESRYRPTIVGNGAIGMMQLIPYCHKATMDKYGYSLDDLFEPYKNMLVGSEYLASLVHKYNDIPFALTCYNKGEGGALASGKKTSYYSDEVMKVYNRLAGGDIL